MFLPRFMGVFLCNVGVVTDESTCKQTSERETVLQNDNYISLNDLVSPL